MIAHFLAQATNFSASANAAVSGATNAAVTPDSTAASPGGSNMMLLMYPVLIALLYFAFFRPQSQAKKKQEAMLKAAKTGDRVVTTGGIHGVITNVKDTTVIVKVADNVKLEIEKNHLDKIIRTDPAEPEKVPATKS
jgi:preprotein translocase subunit YajC